MRIFTGEVQEYKFHSFSDDKGRREELYDFEFKKLNNKTPLDLKKDQIIIKKERNFSESSGFNISPIVKEHRGMEEQEQKEKERHIQNEVNKRIDEISEKAYKDGHEEGMKIGREDVYKQTRADMNDKLISMNEMISELLSTKENIFKAQKEQLYTLIKNITKWIILKELKDDGEYIKRILEKIILDLGTTSNLLIQIDQKHFDQIPEALESVQEKLGEFKNVRIETDYDIQGAGIIIESENGIINGTLSEQFKSFDKLFESVGLEVSPDNEEIDFNE